MDTLQGVYRSLNSWEYTRDILGSEKAYLEKPWINLGTGIPWKKVSGCFKYLDSLEKFVVVVVVVVTLADGCNIPEVHRTFHESTRKLLLKAHPSGFETCEA